MPLKQLFNAVGEKADLLCKSCSICTVNCQFLREKSRSLPHTLHLMLIEILCLLHIFPVFSRVRICSNSSTFSRR